ncbi:unnamed protein product [Lactuca virosa]|uniref:ATP synthase mitochondrial F1 complex assembly factor 1 n=1 Tax=Lactuca virosa TaxID=75947 RepID=A0AAU9PDQ6_9ASTR|nr:unnamed protein product [Lactuca virosa]
MNIYWAQDPDNKNSSCSLCRSGLNESIGEQRSCSNDVVRLVPLSPSEEVPASHSGHRFLVSPFISSCDWLSCITTSTENHNATCDFHKSVSIPTHSFSSFASGFTPLKHKPLESLIDVERAKLQTPEDLASIWDDFHIGRGHIGASMKTKLYKLLEHRAADCRYFVIPVWKGSGYTTMFMQVQMPHILFTGLEDYKARGTQASPYFTISHYKEFCETKDLVLIRGDVVFTSKLTDSEAKWLLETAQSFYLNDMRYKLVERFNKNTIRKSLDWCIDEDKIVSFDEAFV